jgi:hypothetical protein
MPVSKQKEMLKLLVGLRRNLSDAIVPLRD